MTNEQKAHLVKFFKEMDALDEWYAEDLNEDLTKDFAWEFTEDGNQTDWAELGFTAENVLPLLAADEARAILIKEIAIAKSEVYVEEESDFSYELERERACYARGF